MTLGDAGARIARRFDRRWLAALFAIDVLLIALHVAQSRGWLTDEQFSMLNDRGYAEIFRYLETLVITWSLLRFAKRHDDRFCFATAALFFYVFLDDAFRVHEYVGIWLTDHVAPFAAAGAMGHAFGELAYLAVVGVVWLAIARRATQDQRPQSGALRQEIGAVIAILAVCGIGLDFLHSLGGVYYWHGLGLLEGSGELFAFSFATAYFVALPGTDQTAEK